MIDKYNRFSFLFGVPGILLQIVGVAMRGPAAEGAAVHPLSILGTILLLVGLGYYAVAKGRSPAWCLFAFLSLIGLIVLACLEDRARDGTSSRRY